jgi:hypothetical protein
MSEVTLQSQKHRTELEALCFLNFDGPLHLIPGAGFYSGSHAELLGWCLIEHETRHPELAAAASGKASAAGMEGMSICCSVLGYQSLTLNPWP